MQLLVSNIDYDEYIGRIAVGRVERGNINTGMNVAICKKDDKIAQGKIIVANIKAILKGVLYKEYLEEQILQINVLFLSLSITNLSFVVYLLLQSGHLTKIIILSMNKLTNIILQLRNNTYFYYTFIWNIIP